MQTPPIPLNEISDLLRKAETDPASLTPAEVERITTFAADLGPALDAVGGAIASALEPVLSALADALLEALPLLEEYSRRRAALADTSEPRCDLGTIAYGLAGPCQLAAGHDGGCDPRA